MLFENNNYYPVIFQKYLSFTIFISETAWRKTRQEISILGIFENGDI